MTPFFKYPLLLISTAAAIAAGQGDTTIDADCGFHSACGSSSCYDANVTDCVDGVCQLQDPLPEAYQRIVDTGVSSPELLLEQACTEAVNSCDGTLYDTEEFYCVNDNVVAKDTMLPCGNPVSTYCQSDQVCSESESGAPTCTDISALCGDGDKETLCSSGAGQYYDVLMTTEKTGNLQFKGESATWGIGSFSADFICDVDCNSQESTPAPSSAAVSMGDSGALLMVAGSAALAVSLVALLPY